MKLFIASASLLVVLAATWACIAGADVGDVANGDTALLANDKSNTHKELRGSTHHRSRKLSATGDSGDCSRCPADYAPVVDMASGLPFYNDCLGRCQLGKGAKLVPAAEAAKATKAASKSGAAAPDLSRLLPPPAAYADVQGQSASAPHVTQETMTRFAKEGFVYVGRPGFSTGATTAAASSGDTQRPLPKRAAAQASSAAAGDPTTMVALRITNPGGDMYMNVHSKSKMAALVHKYISPSSPDFAVAKRLAEPTLPSDDSNTAAPPEPHRRNLAIVGNDDRREVTVLKYPYTAVTKIFFDQNDTGIGWLSHSCSGSLLGLTGRLGLTAAYCLFGYDDVKRRALGWNANIQVIPGYHGGGIKPYGTVYADVIEVVPSWTTSVGNWDFSLGWFRLTTSMRSTGSLGYTSSCGTKAYSLTTAGYFDDKPFGTLWTQATSATVDVCTSAGSLDFNYDSLAGQAGSAFWTADNYARMVESYMYSEGSVNGATLITPTYYSLISSFVTRNIKSPSSMVSTSNGQNTRVTELISKDGRFQFVMQGDRNIVLYKQRKSIWNSRTRSAAPGNYSLYLQTDGNLVADDQKRQFWASNTPGQGTAPYSLEMQDDGDCVLYDANRRPTWSTGTGGKH